MKSFIEGPFSAEKLTKSGSKLRVNPPWWQNQVLQTNQRPTGFLFEAISIDLFVCLCILAVEVISVHIGMIVCMVKYRLYRNRYQSLKDLKKFKGKQAFGKFETFYT